MTGTGLCVLSNHGTGANGEPMDREAEIGLLCPWHRKKLTDAIVDVRDLWMDLAFIDQAGSAPKDDTPRTRHLKLAEPPAPANLEVLALRDPASSSQRQALTRYAVMHDGWLARVAPRGHEPAHGEVDDRDPRIRRIRAAVGDQTEPIPSVPAVVASWTLLVAEERPITTDLPASTVAQLQLLQRHGDWLAAQDWITDLIIELTDLRKALSAALRDQPHRKVGTCNLPTEGQAALCGGALIKDNGDDVIRCRQCGAAWVTPQERARLAISLEST